MFDFFEKLRKKTRRERHIFALVLSLCITLFIFGLWAFLALPNTFESMSEKTEEDKDFLTPLANAKNGFQNLIEPIFDELSDLKDKISSSFDQQFVAPDIEEKSFKNSPENANIDE